VLQKRIFLRRPLNQITFQERCLFWWKLNVKCLLYETQTDSETGPSWNPFQEAFFIGPAFNKPPMTLKLFRKAACEPVILNNEYWFKKIFRPSCYSVNILANMSVLLSQHNLNRPHLSVPASPNHYFLQTGDSGDWNLIVKKLFVDIKLLFSQGGHSVRADGTPRVQKRLHHSQKVRTKSRM